MSARPRRVELKAILRPSGDQLGPSSLRGCSISGKRTALWRRLWHLNLFTLALFVFVPVTTPGEPMFSLGPVVYSREGFLTSASIALKANAIVLMFTALLGTVEPFTLGHAFHQLRVPGKLINLMPKPVTRK